MTFKKEKRNILCCFILSIKLALSGNDDKSINPIIYSRIEKFKKIIPEITCRSVSDGHNNRYTKEFTAKKNK
jgi:hypothetical protein